MSNFCRRLDTDIQVEPFVEGILGITNAKLKRRAINSITQAERNIKDYPLYPTLTHRDNRDFQFRDDDKRKILRKQIVDELYTLVRLPNDDEIALGKGGAVPQTKTLFERKAFYIIGPPASGKSGIAQKIADKFGCYILDSDYAKRKLPEYKNQIGSASLVHDESDSLIFGKSGLVDVCTDKGANIVIPKIGHNLESIVEYCKMLKEKAGYDIYLISVDLDRQKATQRAYRRYVETKRYVPLSLIFDGYANQPTLNYFKIKQRNIGVFKGFGQISTDVPLGYPVKLIESQNIDDLNTIDWR